MTASQVFPFSFFTGKSFQIMMSMQFKTFFIKLIPCEVKNVFFVIVTKSYSLDHMSQGSRSKKTTICTLKEGRKSSKTYCLKLIF